MRHKQISISKMEIPSNEKSKPQRDMYGHFHVIKHDEFYQVTFLYGCNDLLRRKKYASDLKDKIMHLWNCDFHSKHYLLKNISLK